MRQLHEALTALLAEQDCEDAQREAARLLRWWPDYVIRWFSSRENGK